MVFPGGNAFFGDAVYGEICDGAFLHYRAVYEGVVHWDCKYKYREIFRNARIINCKSEIRKKEKIKKHHFTKKRAKERIA